MRNNPWIFALVFVAALVVAVLVLRDGRPFGAESGFDPKARVVRVYAVPVDRGDAIRDALRVVLLANREQAEPLGQASLPLPGQLMVTAPASMHDSIAQSIDELTRGTPVETPASAISESVAIELWVVAVASGPGTDDPALAPASEALAQARSSFSLGRMQLVDRAMAVSATDGAVLSMRTGTLNGNFRLNRADAEQVRLAINLELREAEVAGRGAARRSDFGSTLLLRDREWQVVGLLSGNESGAPERLLLLRMTRNASGPVPGK